MFCFVSYADTNVSTGDEDVLREAMQNRAMLSAGIGAWAYYALMSSLGPRAINGTTSPPMFAAGTYVYDANASNGTLYGLMQCMRDRTAADCNRCLQDSMLQLASCCSGHQGGVVLGYNCYLRMEVYPFYDVALDAHAAPNSSNRERSPGEILLLTNWSNTHKSYEHILVMVLKLVSRSHPGPSTLKILMSVLKFILNSHPSP
jgi:hypothetical protein